MVWLSLTKHKHPFFLLRFLGCVITGLISTEGLHSWWAARCFWRQRRNQMIRLCGQCVALMVDEQFRFDVVTKTTISSAGNLYRGSNPVPCLCDDLIRRQREVIPFEATLNS